MRLVIMAIRIAAARRARKTVVVLKNQLHRKPSVTHLDDSRSQGHLVHALFDC